MKNIITTTAAAAAIILALAGCASTEGAKSDAPAAAPAATVPAQEIAVEAIENETPEAEPTESGPLVFGETFEYDDGIAITVKLKGSAKAGKQASGAEETKGQMYLFDVTIKNNGSKTFDPAMANSAVNYGDDGTPAEQVFDSNNGIGDSFQGKILPGKKQTITMGYAIPTDRKQEITFTTAPSWDHEDALFFGTASKK